MSIFEIRLKNNYNLRKLIYYIYWGESANTGECIVDLIRIMKKKHVKELQDAGEELLFDYINALKEQLHLAQSVYIVASDNGEFCNKRNMKKIFD